MLLHDARDAKVVVEKAKVELLAVFSERLLLDTTGVVETANAVWHSFPVHP